MNPHHHHHYNLQQQERQQQQDEQRDDEERGKGKQDLIAIPEAAEVEETASASSHNKNREPHVEGEDEDKREDGPPVVLDPDAVLKAYAAALAPLKAREEELLGEFDQWTGVSPPFPFCMQKFSLVASFLFFFGES